MNIPAFLVAHRDLCAGHRAEFALFALADELQDAGATTDAEFLRNHVGLSPHLFRLHGRETCQPCLQARALDQLRMRVFEMAPPDPTVFNIGHIETDVFNA